ncbi:DNA polymerase III subunit gamma/tau [Brevibacillus parabrevis]|uniref:DNA polymerase III subunit gamma/tau n=1 Tax=Brevibacillus parabrevis TaxID=54914 RepID=UPI001C224A71|nr:DNA polymerase III subunit gamma/tau [Brevibacillus parabrevis]MBU8711384.1 DNA polymerase III subunit gamma/tau [Brevibacillus parabrevis]WDV93215.1 DNA polymerase III subunit gamma/tau [Brevibacillus parabrevis]
MRKRELLFGFGAGLIVAASALGLMAPKSEAPSPALTEAEIKQAATELQMVVLTPEEYKQWQEEKKVNVHPAPNAPKAPAAPNVEQTKTPAAAKPQTPGVNEGTPPSVNSVQETSSAAESKVQSAAAPAQTETPQEPAVETPVVKKTASFTVPYKATAEGVAATLVKEGILPANNHFVDQLRTMDKLNRIRVGTYQVSLPASEEEIVKLITTPPKK